MAVMDRVLACVQQGAAAAHMSIPAEQKAITKRKQSSSVEEVLELGTIRRIDAGTVILCAMDRGSRQRVMRRGPAKVLASSAHLRRFEIHHAEHMHRHRLGSA